MSIEEHVKPTALEASPLDALPMLYFTDESFNASGRMMRIDAYRRERGQWRRGYVGLRASADLALAATWEALTMANSLTTAFLVGGALEGRPVQGVAAVGSGLAAYFGTRLLGFGLTRLRRKEDMREASVALVYETRQ